MFYDNFIAICEKKGIRPAQVARELNINQSTIAMWKSQGTKPNAVTLVQLAEYFGMASYELMDIPRAKPVSPSDSDYIQPLHGIRDIEEEALKKGMIDDFERLNPTGKREAAIRVNELTEIPRYQKGDKNGNSETTDA